MPDREPMFWCPYCGEDFGDSIVGAHDLAGHLYSIHGWRSCPCGVKPIFGNLSSVENDFCIFMVRHLAKIPDLEMHLAEAELLKAVRERRGRG